MSSSQITVCTAGLVKLFKPDEFRWRRLNSVTVIGREGTDTHCHSLFPGDEVSLKTPWQGWSTQELLFYPTCLCFPSRTPLPHTAEGPRCQWPLEVDCWVSAWLAGLCRQSRGWTWWAAARATPVPWDTTVSCWHGRKGALLPPLSSTHTTSTQGVEIWQANSVQNQIQQIPLSSVLCLFTLVLCKISCIK